MLIPVSHWGNAFPRLKIAAADFYYKLEEASGTRVDSSPNALNLTAVNTPGQAAGKVGNCATFDNANERKLTRADATALRFNENQTLFSWVKLTSKAGSRYWCGKWNVGGEYLLSYEAAQDRFRFYLDAPGGATAVFANNFGSPSTDVWYFVTAIRDGSTMKLSVNNGTFDTGTRSGYDTSAFRVFSVGGLDESGYCWDGSVDQVIKFPFVATSLEIAHLYNSGSGRELS